MPHTSHKKKPPRQKRTQVVDEDGWTRVSSKQPIVDSRSQSKTLHNDQIIAEERGKRSHVNPAPPEEGMTDERLRDRYQIIEGRWLSSDLCKDLTTAVEGNVDRKQVKTTTAVLFGTGSMSGLREGWIYRPDVALCQVAAFQTVIGTIEKAQGSRPQAYAQEPCYNVFDIAFLGKLGITKVDSPEGWELVNEASFTFCPMAEDFVSMLTIERNPAFHLAQTLQWLRECKEGLVMSEWRRDPVALAIIDKFMASHIAIRLPEFDAPDEPLHGLILYSQQPADED